MHKPPSMEAAQEQRLVRLLKVLFDLSFGTLWWVPDRLWKEQLKAFRTPTTPRKHPFHPGVSLWMKAEVNTLLDPVPLLFGSSSNSDDVVKVKGLSSRFPESITCFGSILSPANFSAQTFLTQRAKVSLTIAPHSKKPRLVESEIQALWAWAERHDLIEPPLPDQPDVKQ